MRKLPLLMIAACFIFMGTSCRKKPRIAIAGLGIESSTFSPARTDEAAFHAKYGDDVFSTYPFLSKVAREKAYNSFVMEPMETSTLKKRRCNRQRKSGYNFDWLTKSFIIH